MKFAVAEWPEEPRTKDTKTASIGLAAVLVVMVTAQLFRLDNFIPLLDEFDLPGVSGRAAAVTLTVASVLAIPFLLRMKLSVGFRFLSMLSGWVAVGSWLLLTLWLSFSGVVVDNVGFLGSEVTLIPGVWSVFVALALVVLAVWSSWGLWPGKRRAAKEVELKKSKASSARNKANAKKVVAKVKSSSKLAAKKSSGSATKK